MYRPEKPAPTITASNIELLEFATASEDALAELAIARRTRFCTDADPVVDARRREIAGHGAPAAVRGHRQRTPTCARVTRGHVDVALTPRHSARVVATVDEADGRGRIGVQVSFHRRASGSTPTRIERPSELLHRARPARRSVRSAAVRLFANADNLTDVRQTDWDPIARPAPDVDGRWTVDAWGAAQGPGRQCRPQGRVLRPPAPGRFGEPGACI